MSNNRSLGEARPGVRGVSGQVAALREPAGNSAAPSVEPPPFRAPFKLAVYPCRPMRGDRYISATGRKWKWDGINWI